MFFPTLPCLCIASFHYIFHSRSTSLKHMEFSQRWGPSESRSHTMELCARRRRRPWCWIGSIIYLRCSDWSPDLCTASLLRALIRGYPKSEQMLQQITKVVDGDDARCGIPFGDLGKYHPTDHRTMRAQRYILSLQPCCLKHTKRVLIFVGGYGDGERSHGWGMARASD